MYYMDSVVTSCQFVGTYNPDTTYSTGDLCVRDDDMWIFDGTTWEVIEERNNSCSEEVTITTQCRNCGAPTNGEGKCPYCGTYNHKIVKRYI